MLRILIADDDPETLAILAGELAQPGRLVATAPDGQEALATARSFAPHLVITDVQMPHMSGWEFVARLRRHPETALTPVIFATGATAHVERLRGLRLGAVDYVGKPFDLEELALRVENVLAHSLCAQEAVQSALVKGVAGSLAQLSLASILNLLAMERRTGVLHVRTEGADARLMIRGGDVVSAHLGGAEAGSGAGCVYFLLGATAGQFVFSQAPVTAPDEIGIPTIELLLEAARRADEATRAPD